MQEQVEIEKWLKTDVMRGMAAKKVGHTENLIRGRWAEEEEAEEARWCVCF